MWSILTDPLPDSISVNGVVFGVRTDYRVWLRAGQLLSAAGTQIEQPAVNQLMTELFELIVPADERPRGRILGSDFIEAVSYFYAGPQKEEREPDEPEPNKPRTQRTFDFGYDAGYIYQSFASFYHIRLIEAEMHWWEFLTLFNGLMLSDENSMSFVLGVRQKKMTDVPKQQKAAYGKMKKEFALPKSDQVKQAENAVFDMLEEMWKGNNGGQPDHQD